MAKRNTKGSLKLSPKHGVNPSVLHCFICGKETGLALLGKLKDDAEAPHDISNPNELCDDCKKALEKGKFIIEVKDNTDQHNPERTGRYVCIKKEALPDIASPICYMEHAAFSKLFNEFIK